MKNMRELWTYLQQILRFGKSLDSRLRIASHRTKQAKYLYKNYAMLQILF